jgi:hypothetical protein
MDFAAVKQLLLGLSDQLVQIKSRAAPGDPNTSTDVRHVCVSGLQQSLLATSRWFACLQYIVERNGQTESGLEDTRLGADKSIGVMIEFLRHSLIVQCHFHIEHLLKSINQTLRPSPSANAMWLILDELHKSCLISDGERKDILLLTHIRNSFHSNGIHRPLSGKATPIVRKIDDLEFSFQVGTSVNCASWVHIVVLLRTVFRHLDTLMQHADVKSIKAIPDQFAALPPSS